MKISKLLLLTFLTTSSLFGQSKSKEDIKADKERIKLERRQAKEQEKLEKEQRKKQEKTIYEKLRQIEIDMDEVAKFPQNYVDRTLRAKAIFLGELKPYTEGNSETVYFVDVKTRTGEWLFNFPTMNGVTFVVTEPMAREIFAYYKEKSDIYRDYYPGHVLFDIVKFTGQNNQVFYFAKVRCIEFISIVGVKWQTVGNCSV